MQLNLSGHHVEVTEAIKTNVESKVAKIAKHYPCLSSINGILTVEKNQQSVELDTSYESVSLSVKASDKDMYVAIAAAAKKLEAALSHRKGVLKASRNKAPEPVIQDEVA